MNDHRAENGLLSLLKERHRIECLGGHARKGIQHGHRTIKVKRIALAVEIVNEVWVVGLQQDHELDPAHRAERVEGVILKGDGVFPVRRRRDRLSRTGTRDRGWLSPIQPERVRAIGYAS